MYELSEDVMSNKELTHASKLVLAVILEFSKINPDVNLSYATIAQKISVNEITVMRSVKQLIALGWISCAKNDRGWNCYKEIKNET